MSVGSNSIVGHGHVKLRHGMIKLKVKTMKSYIFIFLLSILTEYIYVTIKY